MTADAYYRQLLKDIAVPMEDIEAAREARDDLGAAAVEILKGWGLGSPGFFAAGALAAGTQIAPLNDVDLVVRANKIRTGWKDAPRRALEDLCVAMGAVGYTCETGAHAVKVMLPGERFTADVVFGCVHPEQGLWIPHCPKGEVPAWIRTDPKAHRDQVKQRNRDLGVEFAREIRIAKALNRKWALADAEGRKPLSSFHMTALALALITTPVDHARTTPRFLEAAARRVLTPMRDPAGVGPDLEARDPARASALLAEAARLTREALAAGDDAERILRTVFGDPATTTGLAAGRRASVVVGGTLALGTAGRAVGMGRSYGDLAR